MKTIPENNGNKRSPRRSKRSAKASLYCGALRLQAQYASMSMDLQKLLRRAALLVHPDFIQVVVKGEFGNV